MFVGCEGRQTPTIIFVSSVESESGFIRDWIKAELNDEHKHVLVRKDEIVIHPDWQWGSAAFMPSTKHSMTQRSLAEWRQHASYPTEELEFLEGNWTPMETTSVPAILEASEEDYWVGELQSITSRGSCVGQANIMVTSRHVTRGAPINLYRNGYSYKWLKPFYDSAKEDVVVYGESTICVESAEVGEVLCVLCPIRKIAKFLVVTRVKSEMSSRTGALFYDLRPINIDEHYTKLLPSTWKGVSGMSGCPIFNVKGKLVSIYGLGKVESRSINELGAGVMTNATVNALTVMAPDMRPEIVPTAFFRAAAVEVVTMKYKRPISHFVCVAPTGTGKTIYLTKNLLEVMGDCSRVLLLQPTVAAVVGAYHKITQLLELNGKGSNIYNVKYFIGQRNNIASQEIGYGKKMLTLMTYGRALMEIADIERSYEFILLDEIHNLNDPTVLACDLRLTKSDTQYKCVHLSATISVSGRGKLLVPHMNIDGTRFKIDETIKIEPLIKETKDECLKIPNDIVGIKLEGFEKGYQLPMAPLQTGRIVFFVASKRDCERLVQYFMKSVRGDRQYLVLHSGTKIDITSLPSNVWLVCTDIVGQSVTIPGCRAVVDFMQEIKPLTRLYCNEKGIVYKNVLERRKIDQFVSKQRKGRTGRTNAGWYITPIGVVPIMDNGIDSRTIAEAILRLRATVGFNNHDIKDYYKQDVLNSIKHMDWIIPEKLSDMPFWHKVLDEVDKRFGSKVSRNMHDKLVQVHGVNGDLVYLYLTPVISKELVDKTYGSKELSRTGSMTSDEQFYKKYETFTKVVDKEEEREHFLNENGLVVYCDRESLNTSPDLTFELFHHLVSSNPMSMPSTSQGGMSDDDYIEDSASFGIMMSAAVACTAMTGIYWWLENNAARRVVRASVIPVDHVVSSCKYYSSRTVEVDRDASISKLVVFIRKNIGDALNWMGTIGVTREKRDSESLIAVVQQTLQRYFDVVPAAWHIGLVPSLVSLFGASVIGSWFGSIEEVVGATLATALLMAVNSAVAILLPIPSVIAFAVTELIAFIISSICNRKTVTYDSLGRRVSYPNRAWRLVFGGISGLALGKCLVAPLLVMKGVNAVSAPELFLRQQSISNLGRAGSAVLVIKHIYVTMTKIQDGRLGIQSLAPVISAATLTVGMDFTTLAIGTLLSVALVVIKQGLSFSRYQAGTNVKGVRSTDGRNPYVEDYFGNFDDFALSVLGAGAVLANPTSIVSISIAWINASIRRGEIRGVDLKEAFEVYSGVPISVAIITEGLKWISTWGNGSDVNHSSLLFSLPSAIAGMLACVYYVKQPVLRAAVQGAWQRVSSFVMASMGAVLNCLQGLVTDVVKWLGRQFGEGMTTVLPKWLRPKSSGSGAIVMGETFVASRPEPVVIGEWMAKRWRENAGLTLIERLYFGMSMATKENSGIMPPSSYQQYTQKTGRGISFVWEFKSRAPFEAAKVTTSDYGAFIKQFSLQQTVLGGVLEMKRNGLTIKMEASYTSDVSVAWLQVDANYSSFGMLIVGREFEEGTKVNVIAYNVSSSVARKCVESFSDVHPLMVDIGTAVELKELTLLKAELNVLLALKQNGISLDWRSFSNWLALGAVSVYTGASNSFFGGMSGVKFGRAAYPDEWLQCPESFDVPEWSMICYYVLAFMSRA